MREGVRVVLTVPLWVPQRLVPRTLLQKNYINAGKIDTKRYQERKRMIHIHITRGSACERERERERVCVRERKRERKRK